MLLSAGIHALAFPPWNVTPLAFVAVVPFLLAIRDLKPRHAALAGYLWGSAAIWGVGYWVAGALVSYYEQPWWFGIVFCLVGCQILWGAYYALFAAAAAWSASACPLTLALFWVACEFGRAQLLTGEPWMLLGYALTPYTSLVQVADIGSVYLVSFAAILVNASVAELVLRRGRSPRQLIAAAAPAAVVLAAFYGYGVFRLAAVLPSQPAVAVAVVQGNNDLGTQWRRAFYGRGLERYLRMSEEAAHAGGAQLLVWPESAVTFFLAHEPAYLAVIGKMLGATGADLIVGAPHHDGEAGAAGSHFYNSAFYVTAAGRLSGRYDKGHLLPFAEYFPLRFIELLRRHFERVRYFTPGDGRTLLQTRAGKAAVVICFEAIFPEIVREKMNRGASFLVNLSNDVWLGRNAGPAQHLAMVTLRAIENRTWVVRATTTGISAVIDPFGRVVTQSALFTPAVLHAHIVPLHLDTPYKRFGDVFAYACVGLSLAAIAMAYRKKRSPEAP